MSKSRSGHLRLVQPEEVEEHPFERTGRPTEARGRLDWMPLVVRVLVVAWAGAVAAALIDEFRAIPHLPFLTAMGMTGALVLVTFAVTRHGVPDWRGDLEPVRQEDDEQHATDLLTELPTFAHFQRRVHEAFVRGRRLAKPFSVVLIDVNNLTAVNKEYGVRAGDEVLRHVARAVDGTRRYNDVVARLGDDEFGVLLADCNEGGVKAFIDRLEERLSRESAHAVVDGRPISLWAGICTGSATSAPEITDSETVLELAIDAMTRTKEDRERRRRMWLSA